MSLGGNTVGTGVIPIKPDTSGFGDELERGVTSEGSTAAETSGGKVGAVFKKAMLVAAAGVGALLGKSVFDFAGFDTGMNEVFTLMPDISGRAMDDMTQQVKDFAVEFKTLPQDVVPALYQSLSAGVPRDNVFDFLETSTKLAKGGATDLTTAVDGLSSAVNAYGPGVLSAQEASDAMFTAVKLGKTTVEELSGALFNVTPTAAGLGVSFGDVSAAMAAMTLQGVPTSVASTQLRQALIELSKDGGETADTFQSLSGKTFKEFIAGGGDLQQALALMSDGAAASGVSVSDMFSSVEAGAAALALTGTGAQVFADDIAAMKDSAGATETAYDRMNTGIGAGFDQLKALAAVAMINLGQAIAPVLQKIIAWVSKNWPTIQRVFGEVFDTIHAGVSFFVDNVLTPLVSGFEATFGWLMDNKEFLIGIAAALTVAIVSVFVSWVAATIPVVVANLALAASAIAAWAPFILIGLAIAGVVGGVIYAYNHFKIFKTVIDAVARFFKDTLWPIMQSVFGWLRDNVPPIIQGIIGVFSWLWNNVLSPLGSFLSTVFSLAWSAVKLEIDIVTTAVNAIIAAASWLWNNVLSPLVSFLGDVFGVAWAAVKLQIDLVKDAFGLVSDAAGAVWHDFLEPIVTFLGDAFGTALSGVTTALGAVGTAFSTLKTMASDAVTGVVNFIKELPGKLLALVQTFVMAGASLGSHILQGFKDGLSAIAGFAGDVADSVVGVVKDAWNAIAGLINDFIPNSLGWGPFKIDLPDNPIPTFGTGALVPTSRLAVIGDAPGGEAVLTRPQVQDLARWAQLTDGVAAGVGSSSASASANFPDEVTLIIEGEPFRAILQRNNREMASALLAGRRQ